MKVMSIVAWALVVVLLIGAGALAFLNSQQSGRVAGLRDALTQVAATAGVQDLAPEALKDAAALPDVLQKVQAAIQAGQQEPPRNWRPRKRLWPRPRRLPTRPRKQ